MSKGLGACAGGGDGGLGDGRDPGIEAEGWLVLSGCSGWQVGGSAVSRDGKPGCGFWGLRGGVRPHPHSSDSRLRPSVSLRAFRSPLRSPTPGPKRPLPRLPRVFAQAPPSPWGFACSPHSQPHPRIPTSCPLSLDGLIVPLASAVTYKT